MSLLSFAFGSIRCGPHQCCTHRIETGFSYELSLIYNNAFSSIFSPSLLTKLRRLPPLKFFRVTMITFLIILEVAIMVTSGRHFYCDSLGENTRGSGKNWLIPGDTVSNAQHPGVVKRFCQDYLAAGWQEVWGSGQGGVRAETFQQGSAIVLAPALRKHLGT